MKKILAIALMLVIALGAISFAEDIEAVAGRTNYVVDLKLHNFVQNNYTNKIEAELGLPVADMLKMYITMAIEDNMDTNVTSTAGYRVDTYATLNNNIKLYFGIPVNENVGINFYVGGGTNNNAAGNAYILTIPVANSGYERIETYNMKGVINLAVGIKLASAMFGSVISDLKIRQFVDLAIGDGPADATFTVGSTTVTTGTGTYTDTTSKYFGIDYTGRILTGIPFDIGLPKFELGLELGYVINSISYSKAEMTDITLYDKLPAKIGGGGDVKVNLAINYSNFENNIWVNPGISGSRYSWTVANANSETYTDKFQFDLKVGANWKTTFAKIVWLKLDAEWTLQVATTQNNSGAYTKTVQTLFNNIDPGIKIGFNWAEGWSAELGWKPSLAVSANPIVTKWTGGNGDVGKNVQGADSNVWNLANWDFSVKCDFAKPMK